MYLVFLSVFFFAILPEFMRRQLQENGVTISTIGFNYWVTFAICVLQIAIVFFCVGIMHLVGYRWGVRRRLPAEGLDVAAERIPPILIPIRRSGRRDLEE